MFYSRVYSGLTHKHFIKDERPARNKHSSLFHPFVNYEENKVLRLQLLISERESLKHFLYIKKLNLLPIAIAVFTLLLVELAPSKLVRFIKVKSFVDKLAN